MFRSRLTTALAACAIAGSAVPGRAAPFKVTVHAGSQLAGAPVTVLRMQAGDLCYTPSELGSLDSEGKLTASVDPGECIFAVSTTLEDGTLVSLAASKNISASADVRLESISPAQIEFTADEARLDLLEFSIRLPNVAGELVCKDAGTDSPKLLVSPDQNYVVRAIGRRGDENTYGACWLHLKGNSPWSLKLGRQDPHVEFSYRKGWSSRPAAVNLEVRFPRSRLDVELTDGKPVRLITNRAFCRVAYSYALTDGRMVRLDERGYVWPKRTGSGWISQAIGGDLKEFAHARLLPHEPGEDTNHLCSGVNLVDPRGHLVDTKESQVDFEREVKFVDGPPVGPNPLPADVITRIAPDFRNLAATVRYRLENSIERTLTPQPWVNFRLGVARTELPRELQGLAEAYLFKVNRVHDIILGHRLGKTPKGSVTHWHMKNGFALGQVGGNTIWLSVGNIFNHREWYNPPWALTHELLHNSKFPHGEAMSAAGRLTGDVYRQTMWLDEDSPQQVPLSCAIEGIAKPHVVLGRPPKEATPGQGPKNQRKGRAGAKNKAG